MGEAAVIACDIYIEIDRYARFVAFVVVFTFLCERVYLI